MNNINNQVKLTRDHIDSVMSLYSSGEFTKAIQRIKELNAQ